jgi:hypothetical protein
MTSDTLFIDFLLRHWKFAIVLLIVCEGFGLWLIARLWFTYRTMSAVRKIAWSGVLLVPIVGWLFFAAFLRPPERDENAGHVEHGRDAAGGGDFTSGHHF